MDDYNEVKVYIYDLSAGLAPMLSQSIIGKQLDGIWHTGVVVYGREYFFGSAGIQSCAPGGTILGEPVRVEKLGRTEVPYQLFLEYVFGLGESGFAPGSYDLLKHNCNNFADELAVFLCGHGIPGYILALPDQFINTPLGQTIAPLLAGLSLKASPDISSGNSDNLQFRQQPLGARRSTSPELDQLNQQVNEIRADTERLEDRRCRLNEKLLKQQQKQQRRDERRLRKQQKKQSKLSPPHLNNGVETNGESSDSATVNGTSTNHNSTSLESTNQHSTSSGSTNQKAMPTDPRPPTTGADKSDDCEEQESERVSPITFKSDISNVEEELNGLLSDVQSALSPEDLQSVSELRQYLIVGEGAWTFGETFVESVGRILHDRSLANSARVHLLNAISVACLRDDFILVLHQDRKQHQFMNYADSVDRLPDEEQQALTLTFANMFEQRNCSEWLLYISEWQNQNSTSSPTAQLSNIRITTKVAVNALLCENCERMQQMGTAIMYNLAVKEVKTVKFRTNLSIRQAMPAGSLNRVFDDVATELAMAILQYFQSSPSEELVFRCLTALAKFAQVSHQDVPQLISMIGPAPDKFRGLSPRCDSLVSELETRMARVAA